MVSLVVTLAAPHAAPVLMLQPSMASLYAQLNNVHTSVPLLSISGGRKDYQISPLFTRIPGLSFHLVMNHLLSDVCSICVIPFGGCCDGRCGWCVDIHQSSTHRRLQSVCPAIGAPAFRICQHMWTGSRGSDTCRGAETRGQTSDRHKTCAFQNGQATVDVPTPWRSHRPPV